MNLKKLFPISYQGFLVALIKYVVIAIVASLLIWVAGFVTGWLPAVGALVGWALRIVGILVDVYVVVGIVLSILITLKMIK